MRKICAPKAGSIARITIQILTVALIITVLPCSLPYGFPGGATAQTPQPEFSCAALAPQPGDLGYRRRGSYCEGLYVQPVHSLLRLVSLVERGEVKVAPGLLGIGVSARSLETPRRLRIVARDLRVPYQLDALMTTREFTWPAREVVEPVLGRNAELDAIVWEGQSRPLFLPVSVGGIPSPLTRSPASVHIQAVVVSTIPIESYVARIVGNAGTTPKEIRARVQPAATRVYIDLPSTAPRGNVELWLRVRLLGAATTESQSWLLRLP